ncbi:TPA: nucleotide exchange factor GrpE [Candidatus Galligastranaerophilus intestinavium]|uniref:Protein GrpE n=1 Tax=Candidatus Galligastranaerophilus intestinavium TaxID=2840836 RepID=A0A9D1FIQ6_9BACT|nr:nucleotide exchange factor GrpE [Candidatus Galligastranaerophilus intestinavium]
MFIDNENEVNSEDMDVSNNPFEEKNESDLDSENPEENNSNPDDECEKLRAELADLNNKYIRMAADFDNYRKRQAQERESLLKYGAAETMTKLLAVLDTFERAKESLKDIDDAKSVKESYEVAFKQLLDTLKKAGLETIDALGAEFDPNLHEAIAQTPTNEHPDNTVISQMQTGYKLGDRVLRPALVNVALNEE